MRFPGYQVEAAEDGSITIRCIELDETELTPESNWMEGYPNTDPGEGLPEFDSSPLFSPVFQKCLQHWRGFAGHDRKTLVVARL